MFIRWCFIILFSLVPLFFSSATSELFEYNKMMLTYGLTIIIFTAWIIKIIINPQKIKFGPLGIILLIYLASHVLSTIFSIDLHLSIWGYYSRFHEGLLATLSYVILYFAAINNLTKDDVLKIIKFSFISAIIVSLWGILEHFGRSPSCLIFTGNFDVGCWVQDVQNRVFATLGQPNWMGAYLCILILISLNFAKKYYFVLPILFIIGLYFTKSRSGYLGLAAGIALFILLILKISNKLKLGIGILGLVIGIIGGVYWYQNLPPPGPGVTDSEAIRKPVWETAVKIWQRYPVFGSGVETFAYSYYLDRPVSKNLDSEWDFLYNKAHNEYLNLLATTGTVGIIAYLLVIASVAKQSIFNMKIATSPGRDRDPRNDTLSIALFSAWVTILVTNFFGFSIVIIALYFFLIPAFIYLLKDEK